MQAYRLAADAVLILHAGFVAFVVLGLPLIWLGVAMGWRWVCAWWFRVLHLSAIAVVVIQSWLRIVCPLTDLENTLRIRGGQSIYGAEGCIEYWLHRTIFFTAPPWVFVWAYTLFGLAVVATMIGAPPVRRTVDRAPATGDLPPRARQEST